MKEVTHYIVKIWEVSKIPYQIIDSQVGNSLNCV